MSTALALNDFSQLSDRQLKTIKQTVAKDLRPLEFDLFIEKARSVGLNPLRNEICAIVFSKNNEEKRSVSYITTINGYRMLASGGRDYRGAGPQDEQIDIDNKLVSPSNPLGIISAQYTCYKRDPDTKEWFPVSAKAYWDEYAPMKDVWAYDQEAGKRLPTGEKELNDTWQRMPRLMIMKCAEALCLRRNWTEHIPGDIYTHEEMERAQMIDITPSEAVDNAAKQARLEKLGGPALLFSWSPGEEPERIEIESFAERFLEWLQGQTDADWIRGTIEFNKHAINQFWGEKASDWNQVKKEMETHISKLEKANVQAS